LAPHARVLLIEHLDAIGSTSIDARHHAAALRAAGLDVEGIVLAGERDPDLLFPASERRAGSGFDVLGREHAAALGARVRERGCAFVLWASAAPGGGEAARALPDPRAALWWPTGHAPASAACGPLAPLDPALAPLAGAVLADDAFDRRRLPLWDGPFALLPSTPRARAAAELLHAFASACEEVEVDLVVLAHPDPGFAQLARRAGLAQRVHFVGPAPREAEYAWLGSATVLLLDGDAPVSGGFVLRALGAGCPVLATSPAAAPLRRWLERNELGWEGAGTPLERALAAAFQRDPRVLAARERGRRVAATHDARAVGARITAALRAAGMPLRRAA
jgi:glycosyltransferase involved in cell wall biosynthesis